MDEAIAITMNLAVIDDIAQLPAEATVRPLCARCTSLHTVLHVLRFAVVVWVAVLAHVGGTLLCAATQVEVHRASALGWDGMAAATKSSLPTVSQAGIASTISPPTSPHRSVE